MLTHLHIKGYKCLDDCELPLAPLTLLSGPNASGKSTVIQAILLAFSGIEQKNVSYLKEAVKPFSHFEEIYCRYSDAREIRIDLAANSKDHYTAVMDRTGLNTTMYSDTTSFGYEQNLFYLCAGRSGPEELSEINRDIRIGQHGQFALGLLEQRKDKPVHQALVRRNAHANTLKAQLAWWLSFIVGVETEANTEKVTASTVKTTFQTEGLENISPFNTGAGNSFLLKLMVMCLISQTVEDLARKTVYKIILSSQRSHFPYVNIQGDGLQNHYTITCKPGECRANAIDHLKALLEDSKYVLVCDRHLKANWETSKKFFDLFPRKTVTICFAHDLESKHTTSLKKYCPKWKLKKDGRQIYRNLHDRYLLIDGTMEIVITSGIDYLFDDTKECTLIFRLRK